MNGGVQRVKIKAVFFILFISISQICYAASVKESVWRDNETFSDYLERNSIPVSLLRSVSAEDIKYVSEIQAGEHFYEMKEDDGTLLQALIPIGEEMQIEVVKNLRKDRYEFDIVPIVYRKVKDTVVLPIKKSCYVDIESATNNPRLGFLLKEMYGRKVDFRKLRRGDTIAFRYSQKSRLGKPFGQAKIDGALIESIGKKFFAFTDDDGNVWYDTFKRVRYTKSGERVVVKSRTRVVRERSRNSSFSMPVRGLRLTSRFTYKRWHPILHKYRPHLGVDWGGKRGTPIYAARSGKVVYSGWMRGYGKVVKISHPGGFVSLYAHMSRIYVKRGRYVKRGEKIGSVGSTGRSTGPHLHFGLYRRGRAVNPLKYINKKGTRYRTRKITTRYRTKERYSIVKTKRVAIKGASELKRDLERLVEKKSYNSLKWEEISDNFVMVEDRQRYEKRL
jgi:murein DD-endopeptidase MepM/ murein hydrolase activator NlpD